MRRVTVGILLSAWLGCLGPAQADFTVQVGAFRDATRAERLADRLRARGWPVEVRVSGAGGGLSLVWAGPVATREEAEVLREALLPLAGDALVLPYTPAPAAAEEEESLPLAGTEETPEASDGTPPEETAPMDADALFGLDEEEITVAGEGAVPVGREGMDVLFGLEGEASMGAGRGVGGYLQSELAYTFGGDAHWSKFRNLVDIHERGNWGEGNGWWFGIRAWFDPVYATGDHYPEAVRQDQGFEADIREAYFDLSAGDWDFRLGRQHIVWGEMVGLFFADVVSAKDLREFVLVDFDYLRIPQWAARSEYFKGDFHAEAVWIPYMTYNRLGEYGAEFFPGLLPPPPGYALEVAGGRRPEDTLENTGYGLRLGYLWEGWDVAVFYFSSPDLEPAFAREVIGGPAPVVRYTPVHERVARMGGTFAKDAGAALVKGELIYTLDRPFGVARFDDSDGLVPLDLLDYVLGLEFNVDRWRYNFQFFGRYFTAYDAGIVPDRHETGVSAMLSSDSRALLEPEILFIRSLNRPDWLLTAKLHWRFGEAWRLRFGVDLLQGPANGLFGQYSDRDRVYSELRYSF